MKNFYARNNDDNRQLVSYQKTLTLYSVRTLSIISRAYTRLDTFLNEQFPLFLTLESFSFVRIFQHGEKLAEFLIRQQANSTEAYLSSADINLHTRPCHLYRTVPRRRFNIDSATVRGAGSRPPNHFEFPRVRRFREIRNQLEEIPAASLVERRRSRFLCLHEEETLKISKTTCGARTGERLEPGHGAIL